MGSTHRTCGHALTHTSVSPSHGLSRRSSGVTYLPILPLSIVTGSHGSTRRTCGHNTILTHTSVSTRPGVSPSTSAVTYQPTTALLQVMGGSHTTSVPSYIITLPASDACCVPACQMRCYESLVAAALHRLPWLPNALLNGPEKV